MSTPPSKPTRPWYLRPALLLLMIIGFSGTISSCTTLNYLRGDQRLRQALDEQLKEDKRPLIRISLLRDKARLESVAAHYKRAFPLAIGRTLLSALLFLAASAVFRGRAKARPLLLQCLLASGLFTLVHHQLSGPTRKAMGQAVAREMAKQDSALTQKIGKAAAVAKHEEIQVATENRLLWLELAVYAAAAVAVTRRRTEAFLAAHDTGKS